MGRFVFRIVILIIFYFFIFRAFESTFACEVEATNSRHISKNISKSSKILDYTRRAHVLRDVSNAFHERTCKHESKWKSYESSERRFNHPSLRKNYKPKE